MKNTATAFMLLLVGCHANEKAPICANWLACYSECAPVAVKATELNEAAIVECDLLCRQELGYSAGDPALEASELHTATYGRGFSDYQGIVAADRLSVAEYQALQELWSDPNDPPNEDCERPYEEAMLHDARAQALEAAVTARAVCLVSEW